MRRLAGEEEPRVTDARPGEEVDEEADDADGDAEGVAAHEAGLEDAEAPCRRRATAAGDAVDGAVDDLASKVATASKPCRPGPPMKAVMVLS